MLPIILSRLFITGSIALILYIILFRAKNTQPFYSLNLAGAVIIGPAALMATAMQGANGTSQSLELFYYLCMAGIPLAIGCTIVGFILSRIGKSETSLLFLKIPSIYAALWVLGFFSFAA